MKKWKTISGLLATLVISASAQAELADYDITVSFGSGLTQSQQQVFSDAEAFWESQIVSYADTISFPPGLTITASAEVKDGVGRVLASAGPTNGYRNPANGIMYSAVGNMSFDSEDLADLETRGTLYSVIVHEMAHVIGFGSLWELNGLYSNTTGRYTGAHALAAYQEEFDPAATFVPVELDGGEGTADGHWDETWAGPQSDIMTGYLEGAVTISNTTLAAFRDLGFVMNSVANVANDVPTPALGLLGLGLLGFAGTRRRQK